jgi:hypothetical protein
MLKKCIEHQQSVGFNIDVIKDPWEKRKYDAKKLFELKYLKTSCVSFLSL